MDATRLHRRAAADDGFTLVEVLVSVLVLTGVLLGLAAVQTQSLKSVALSEERQQATGYANALLELARAYTSDPDQFQDAHDHASTDPELPFDKVPGHLGTVIAGSDSGTSFTTLVYLSFALDDAGEKISGDLLDVRAVVTWNSRNGGGGQRSVTLTTQVSRPRPPS